MDFKKKCIGIIGNYGAGNLGDDLILKSIISSHVDINIIVFGSNPKKINYDNTTYLFPSGIRSLLNVYNIFRSIKSLIKCDGFIIGGGGLFQDQQFKAIIIWTIQAIFLRLFRKRYFIYGTSIGPLKRKISKLLTKWVHKNADIITVRDIGSKELLIKIEVNEQKIYTTSDPVFLLNIKQIKCTKNLFTISLRDMPNKDISFFVEIKKVCDYFRREGLDIVFVSMQDRIDKKLVISNFGISKDIKIVSPKSQDELTNILFKTKIAFGMRLHFLIFCILTNTPFVGYSYGPKVNNLLTKLELGDHLIREFKSEDIIDKIKLFDSRNTLYSTTNEKAKAKKNIYLFNEWIQSI